MPLHQFALSCWKLCSNENTLRYKTTQIVGETLTVRERDPYLCAAGSFFFPGLGQVYCGRILRGIVFLIPAVLLTIPYGLVSLIYYGPSPTLFSYWTLLGTPISRIVDFVVRVVSTYDAYKVAKPTEE
jgi:TM2 domain-containing membrane protein YozV